MANESSAVQSVPKRVRLLTILIVVSALAVLSIFSVARFTHQKLIVTTCFQNAEGLRPGAAVRLAGVEVGNVRTIRAQPQDHFCPASVEMVLITNYDLKVPSDSIVEVQTAGVLGESFLEIDSSLASGSAIENWGKLASRETVKMDWTKWPGDVEKSILLMKGMQSLNDPRDAKTESREGHTNQRKHPTDQKAEQ